MPNCNLRSLLDTRTVRLPAKVLTFVALMLIPGAFAQNSSPMLEMLRNQAKGGGRSGGGAVLFQVSTLDALLQGIYNGSVTVRQLKEQGDFGLGTYGGLDGEMIAVNGHYYQMHANGIVTESSDDQVAPFAAVTKFRSGVQFTVNQATMAQLSTLIDSVLPSKNFFYAIRIHGTFTAMSTRAIPARSASPRAR
jgi:acetolactate decarboxylase